MICDKICFESLGATAEFSAFCPEGGVAALGSATSACEAAGVEEWHVILHVAPRGEQFAEQWKRICAAEEILLARPEMAGACCVAKRYFLSDSTNQEPLMTAAKGQPGVSLIQQQPLDGSKIAAWLYLQRGMTAETKDGTTRWSHNGYSHLWHMGMIAPEGDSFAQTDSLLHQYTKALEPLGATMAGNCIRTWFFVRDVDTQYAGMVKARREHFEQQGLTPQTHYIASTGIGGIPAHPKALVQMSTYTLLGFRPEQLRYLYGRTHLNPTYEYGVTFERGACLAYGDREHVFISGTASIDNQGRVVNVGDIVGQTHRMWENVETLLAEADATYDDVMHLIVYLRDMADYETVRKLFAARFPQTPTVFTLAPVCRPTWLIEMECMAIRPATHPEFQAL